MDASGPSHGLPGTRRPAQMVLPVPTEPAAGRYGQGAAGGGGVGVGGQDTQNDDVTGSARPLAARKPDEDRRDLRRRATALALNTQVAVATPSISPLRACVGGGALKPRGGGRSVDIGVRRRRLCCALASRLESPSSAPDNSFQELR
ncbi:unnamed protein product [Merluccius merluccius]